MAEASEQLLGMRLTGRSRGALFLRELEAARPQGVEPQGSIVVEGMAAISAKASSSLSPTMVGSPPRADLRSGYQVLIFDPGVLVDGRVAI